MEQTGLVVSLEENKAKVLIKAKSGCGGCASCSSSCTTNITYVYADNSIDAKIGDKVYIIMERSSYTKMVYLAYIIPTVFLIFGIFIGVYGFKNELLAIFIGFTLCILTYFLFGKLFKNDDYKYKLTKIIS